jgi:hypothetical protein
MTYWRWLAILMILVSGLASCSTEGPAEAPADPEGPALIMFYTDN